VPGVGKEPLDRMEKRAASLESPLIHLKLNPGAKEAIVKLSKTCKLAIVSNDNRPNVEWKLQKFGLLEYFPVIVSANDVKRPKPDAEPIERALWLLGVKKEEAVFIGDNEVDRIAGERAKVRTIIRGNLHVDENFFFKEIFEVIRQR
jgi:HAD superfamily hydrolase (TIGR01549 family)